MPETMNAAIRPNGSPAAQPMLAPTLVPMKMRNFMVAFDGAGNAPRTADHL
jgi:hypothetical protein